MLQVCRTRSDKFSEYVELWVISSGNVSVRPSHPVLIRKLWVNRSYQTAAKHGNQLKMTTLDYCCSCWSPSEIEPLFPFHMILHIKGWSWLTVINNKQQRLLGDTMWALPASFIRNLRNQRVLRPSQVCSTRDDCTRRGKNIVNTNIFLVLQCFWYWQSWW